MCTNNLEKLFTKRLKNQLENLQLTTGQKGPGINSKLQDEIFQKKNPNEILATKLNNLFSVVYLYFLYLS